MNKFAQMKVKTRDGLDRMVLVTCDQMAEVGIEMGWISPVGPAGIKIAGGMEGRRRALVKVATGTRKVKMNVTSWTKMAMDNGWIMYDPITKVAGFFSALGDMAGSAVNAIGNAAGGVANAVGNAWQGAKNLVTGAAQFYRDAAGRVVDAAGRAVNATVNAAGQVVDATGKVVGQIADAAAAGAKNVARGVQQYGRNVAQGAQIAGGMVADAARAGVNNAVAGAKFMVDGAGRVLDAYGRAVAATVNAAGQVLDASGRVIGQAANYVGQVAGQAVADVQKGYADRRAAGDTNFMGAGGQMLAANPVVRATQAVGQAIGQASVPPAPVSPRPAVR